MKPLFIPLNKEHYESFDSGIKTIEYRAYGPRWNRGTCPTGRSVTLSCGYGKQRRLHGEIYGTEILAKEEALADC